MESFYHINRNPNCNWEIGDEIEFGLENNFLWRSYLEKGDFIELGEQKHTSYKIVKHALDYYIGTHPLPVPMRNYHCKPIYTLSEAVASLRHAMFINRELVFESIRKEFYPELPSRHKCMWLIPDSEKSLIFWRNLFGAKNKDIFKVEVDGKIHRASQEWLIVETESLNQINSMAHKYWKGENSGSFNDEILFIGKIKILDNPAGAHL